MSASEPNSPAFSAATPGGQDPPAQPAHDSRLIVALMVIGSLAAGAIHLAVIPGHLAEYRPFGWFFISLGIFQIGWAALLASDAEEPDRRLVIAGVGVNAAVVVLWVATRTVGLPIGPDAWEAESYRFADSLSTLFEFGVVVAGRVLLSGYRLDLKRAAAIAVAVAAVSTVLPAAALDPLAPDVPEMDMPMDMDH